MTTRLIAPGSWDAAITETDGPQLALAGPGAGKTEFLARRASHLITELDVPGTSVLLLTFSRRAAADLRSRVDDALDDAASSAQGMTFHSLAFRLLEAHAPRVFGWNRLPALLTGPEQVGIVGRLLATEDPSDWPTGFREMLNTKTFAGEVTDFLLRASERRLDPTDVAHLAEGRRDWKALPSFMERYASALVEKGRIDYGGVLSSAIDLLADPGTLTDVRERFRYVLVDEYQDTTDAQAELLRRLIGADSNITVTADVNQSIYSFRGADLTNVERFPEAFGEQRPVTTWTLTTSFRVPARILEAARPLADEALPAAASVIIPSGPGGRVDTFIFDQHSHEAEWIASELERLHLEERVPYRHMAVLLRTKRRLLPELSRALDRRGIVHDRPGSRLIDHPAIRIVADLATIASGAGSPSDRQRALRRVLLGPLIGLPLGAERALVREWHRGTGVWTELIAQRLDGGKELATLLSDGGWATDEPAEAGFWHAWTTLPQWSRLVEDRSKPDFRAALASFSQILGRLADRDPNLSLAAFLSLATDDAFEASPLLRYEDEGSDRLTLTTLHQAKGLEFEVVFISDAIDGILPDLRRSFSILNTNQLNPHQRDARSAIRFRLAEERRLAYTAMTRATRRVTWTATAAGIEETDQRPSRFLLEVAGATTPKPPLARTTTPVTGLEAEAFLRRRLTDPGHPSAPERLAALAVLVDRPHPSVRPVEEFSGVASRGPDTGLVPERAAFSPSQAANYQTCPRQYVMQRHLGIGDEASIHMTFGSLIHDVAEIVDRRGLDEGLPTSPERALEVLATVFDPSDFGGGPWAEAWRRRATDIVTRLYANPPPGGLVELVEHALEMELDGERWRGRADRIDRTPTGDLRVVDYKTGTQMPTIAEAASSLQLGFYVLAASVDASVRERGEIAGAELWFPAVERARHLGTRKFDMANLDAIRTELAAIAAAIRAEEFSPTVGDRCASCPVRIVCSEWPEGQEAFVP